MTQNCNMLQFCVVCGLNHINLSLKAPAEGCAIGGVLYCLAAKVYAVFVINFYFFKVCAFFVINFLTLPLIYAII